jgi:hypothetical protein
VGVGGSLSGLNVRTYLARPDAGQKSQNNASDITVDGNYVLQGNTACCGPVPLLGVVSRKTHGSVGTFDVLLPLIAPIGIECRTGGANGDHKIVFTFANPLANVAGASITSGSGSISSSAIGAEPHEYIVNLTGVSNIQNVTVTLTGVRDTAGDRTDTLPVTMGVLLGDVNANKVVSNTDVASIKGQVAAPVTSSNFRNDVNANGVISNTDVSLTKTQVGTVLP